MLLTEPRPPVQRPIGLKQTIIRIISMGCVSSKADRDGPGGAVGFTASTSGSANVNRFQVMNVDDTGRRLCPGQLEVGESDLILHQRGKSPVRWPLRSLRRYGFDAELFSFECGRRCPTGPGIYAFHCQRAEVLFNAVQARVAARHEEHELAGGSHPGNSRMRIRHPLTAHAASSNILLPGNGLLGGLAGREDVVIGGVEEEDGGISSYLEPIRLHHHPGGQQQSSGMVAWSPHSRPLSSASLISSNSSPISPSTVIGGNGGGGASLYANNDILMAAATRVASVESDQQAAALLVLPPSAYANLHDSSSSGGVVRDPDDGSADDDGEDQHHLYINVGPEALEIKASSRTSDSQQQQQQQHVGLIKQVNYVLLDLDKGSDSTTTASVTGTDRNGQGQLNSPEGSVASLPDSPAHRSVCLSTAAGAASSEPAPPSASNASTGPSGVINADGYATIDFDRTAALSNAAVGAPFSALAGVGEEEGLRKTRHNSTMVASASGSHAARLLGLNRQTSSVSE